MRIIGHLGMIRLHSTLTEAHTLATGVDRSTILMRQAGEIHSAAFDSFIETIDLVPHEAISERILMAARSDMSSDTGYAQISVGALEPAGLETGSRPPAKSTGSTPRGPVDPLRRAPPSPRLVPGSRSCETSKDIEIAGHPPNDPPTHPAPPDCRRVTHQPSDPVEPTSGVHGPTAVVARTWPFGCTCGTRSTTARRRPVHRRAGCPHSARPSASPS